MDPKTVCRVHLGCEPKSSRHYLKIFRPGTIPTGPRLEQTRTLAGTIAEKKGQHEHHCNISCLGVYWYISINSVCLYQNGKDQPNVPDRRAAAERVFAQGYNPINSQRSTLQPQVTGVSGWVQWRQNRRGFYFGKGQRMQRRR